MISKESFIKMMDALQKQEEFDREAHNKLGEIFTDFEGYYGNDLINIFPEILGDEMGDKDDWIFYFMYDLDYGTAYKEGDIAEKDGTIIDLSTAEKLYDFLIKEK